MSLPRYPRRRLSPRPPSYQPPPLDLRIPAHPGHSGYTATLAEVHRMESARNIEHGRHSERIAMALTVAAAENRLQGITHVEIEGKRIIGL